MAKNDGGTAFPVVGVPNACDCPGMSLRDYFAAHAPQPPTGWTGTAPMLERLSRADGQIAALMEWRWFYADAMLAEREKDPE